MPSEITRTYPRPAHFRTDRSTAGSPAGPGRPGRGPDVRPVSGRGEPDDAPAADPALTDSAVSTTPRVLGVDEFALLNADVENPGLVAYKNAPGTAGSLDQIVWFLETVNEKGVFPFRYPT